ncbi:GHMP kinase family protein [Striga hermonthica]|uniref:phosphomevalonate kinase n=1 Tax=Striga hermonthica TaxID=68872 RepID=A0A9N7RP64_STRHE|nr:GHMP kinase family protein [Striga hermonthica]
MAVVASAPGKVLMTVGYLILERPNAGIVLSTNARFYAIVKPLYEDLKPDSWAWAWTDVKLTSPQMGRETMYKLSLKHLQLQCVSSSDSRNPFVEYALQYAIAAAHATFDNTKKEELHKLLLLGLNITILGCNEFYSYRNQIEARGLPLSPDSLASLPPFTSITFNVEESSEQKSKPEVAKTGLGSSTAMTTAVVAALLHYLGVVKLSLENSSLPGDQVSKELDVVHIIAQTAHCIAQGCCSRAFNTRGHWRCAKSQLGSQENEFSVATNDVTGTWRTRNRGILNTINVGAVKKWQKSDPQGSFETWKKLSEANSALEMHLNNLSQFSETNSDAYRITIDKCSKLTSEKWEEGAVGPYQIEVIKALLGVRDSMLSIRTTMRKMGEAAGIPIEPESQTSMLDTTMNTKGVLLAGIPGAGGFDAVFAITLGASSSNVVKVWSSLNVLALLVRENPRGVHLEAKDPRTTKITDSVSNIHIG